MAKRKRGSEPAISRSLHEQNGVKDVVSDPKVATTEVANEAGVGNRTKSAKISRTSQHADVKTISPVIQIVTGSYERVLHGITASINLESKPGSVNFSDSFLFNAHASAIRCLSLSPLPTESGQDVYLATGGSDERVNVYSLSTSPLPESDTKGRNLPVMPSLGPNQISENPGNRELGTLVQHSSNITALHFPTRSKLLSASEDNTISISRVRDLAVISTIKAPRPKALGQPSGDTAPLGVTAAGINDFAIHPSMKLMVSVGRGERCMRLWNLVTGKKAGVLNFDRSVLNAAKESKFSPGEGRKIRWNGAGTEFAVTFERAVVLFGQDSQVQCIAQPEPLTKLHQMAYASVGNDQELLAVSTEDGRIIFYNTSRKSSTTGTEGKFSHARAVAQIGGKASGVTERIKDFSVLPPKDIDREDMFVVAASSTGAIRIWRIPASVFRTDSKKVANVGDLIGTYETGSRITCSAAFMMLPAVDVEGGFSDFEGASGVEDTDDDE